MQRTMKRIGALILALAILVTFMPSLGLTEQAHADDEDEKESISVDVIAQSQENAYSRVLRNLEVEAGDALKYSDSYAHAEGYENKVVMIDVIADLHHEIYGEAFENNPTDFLEMRSTGWIPKLFGESTENLGYSVNHRYPTYPDDESTGSMANDTVIEDGDLINVFLYFSEFYETPIYSDRLLYFEKLEYAGIKGAPFTVNVLETPYYRFFNGINDSNRNLVDLPSPDATVVVKNEDGETVATADSDEDGIAELSVDEPGEYTLTVTEIPEDDYEDAHFIAPYAELTIEDEEIAEPTTAEITAAVRNFEEVNKFDIAPQKVTVSSDAAESYCDYGDILYGNNNGNVTLADVLYTLHKNKYGDAFVKGSTSQFLKIAEDGWNVTLFAESASFTASAVNEDLGMVGNSYETTVSDGDQYDLWQYIDDEFYSDVFMRFDEKTYIARAGETFTAKIEGIGWGGTTPVGKADGESFVAATFNESGVLSPIDNAVMDENAEFKLSFDTVGEYSITASGKVETTDWYGNPTVAPGILPWAEVTVISADGAEEVATAIADAQDSVTKADKANSATKDAVTAASKSKAAADKAVQTPGQAAVAAAKKAQTDAEAAAKKAADAKKEADNAVIAAEAAVAKAVTTAEKDAANKALEDAKAAQKEADDNKTAADKAVTAAKAVTVAALKADGKAKKIKSVTVNSKILSAKALDAAVKKAGGSTDYVTKVTIGKKVTKISKKAFAKYKKAKTLVVKTKKLKKASVKGSLKGSKVKTVKVKIGKKSVNKKYVKKYKKIFTKKNAGRKVTVK